MVNVILLQRRVGREIKTIFGGNGGDGPGLLLALHHGFHLAQVAVGAHDAAFVAVVAGEDPQAVLPSIVDYVVDVADCVSRKRINDAPARAAVAGGIDVDFVARGVVEVLSPINAAIWNS